MLPGNQKYDQTALRVGLTGGIASGKTVVADMFAELGVAVIDTDIIARTVVQPGEPALEEIRQQFGQQVINRRGGLDRRAMRRLVFSDREKRLQLEAIVHPRIQQETIRQAEARNGPYQMIVVPLLVESPLRSIVDRILVVDCDEETQLERLMLRDTESEKQARRILATQTSRKERLSIADDLVRNDGDLTATRDQVETLHEAYLNLARTKAGR